MATNINAVTAQAGQLLSQSFGEAQTLANQNADLMLQNGEANVLVKNTENLAVLKAQEQNLNAATALGTNQADAGYLLGQLASDMRMLYTQRDNAILATQAASQKNLFLDGPVEWLSAQVDLPQLQMQQQTSEARLKNAQDMYKQVSDLTQESVATNNAIAQTKNAASIEAEATAIMNTARGQANEAKIKGLQLGAQGIEAAANMQQRVFDNNLRLANEARANEHMQMSREAAARARAEHNERMAQKKQNEKDVTSYLEAVNLHRVSIGLTPMDQQQMRIKSTTQAGKLELDDAFEKGLVTAQTGKQILGNTPWDAMQTASVTPGLQASEGTKKLLQDVGAFAASQVDASKTQPGGGVKGKELPGFANKVIIAEAQRQQKDVGVSGNWYSPPGLATLVDNETRNLPLVTKLVKPALDSGVTEFNPRALFPQALDLVRKGELSMNDAVIGISALGKKAVAYNNGSKNYAGVGVPNQLNLPMKLETTTTDGFGGAINVAVSNARRQGNPLGASMLGFFSSGKSSLVDITDENALNAYASKYLAGQISVDLQRAAVANTKTKK